MNPRLLSYTLQNVQTGVQIMLRDRSTVHMFDLGKTPEGQELVFVMAVVPKDVADHLPTVPSQPLTRIQHLPRGQ